MSNRVERLRVQAARTELVRCKEDNQSKIVLMFKRYLCFHSETPLRDRIERLRPCDSFAPPSMSKRIQAFAHADDA